MLKFLYKFLIRLFLLLYILINRSMYLLEYQSYIYMVNFIDENEYI